MEDRRWPAPDEPPAEHSGPAGWAWRASGTGQPDQLSQWPDDSPSGYWQEADYPYAWQPANPAAAAPGEPTSGAPISPRSPQLPRQRRSPPPAPTPVRASTNDWRVAGEEPAPPLLPALSWTLGAFIAPLLVYLGWVLTLSDQARPGCVDLSGNPCLAPRAQALANLLDALPAIAAALALALLVAIAVRRIASTWRSYKVAFAAGVIGAGAATLVATLLG